MPQVAIPPPQDGHAIHAYPEGHSYDGWVEFRYVLNGVSYTWATMKRGERHLSLASNVPQSVADAMFVALDEDGRVVIG